ncbi:MAG: zinc-binding dehydrogenase [Myxococcales bacterium]|nr:zinc-binding dehydrogenase [Myxococcales bacterium]
MRAVVIHRAGDYRALSIETVPDPECGPDDVVVETRYAGVNYADCIVRMGLYSSAREYVGWPITPGFEVFGTIAKVGSRVTDLRVGHEVVAVTRFGGYATKVRVPRTQVFERVPGFDEASSAGFPAVFLTAHYALATLANARRGEAILVHSCAGGVGVALAQLGRAMGCTVVGVVGAKAKVDTALEAGAHHVIVRDGRSWAKRARELSRDGYRVVLDANGADTLRDSYELLAAPGRLVVYGFASMLPRGGAGRPNWLSLAWKYLRTPRFDPLELTTKNRSVLALNLSYLFEHESLLEESMTALFARAREGKLRPPPVTTFAFDRVADAHRAIESGTTVGKLVLAMP